MEAPTESIVDTPLVDIPFEQRTQLARQVTRLVIPFAFHTSYPEACADLNLQWWKCEDQAKNRLFDHVDRLIDSGDRHETIGRRYVLKQDGRKEYKIPKNTTGALEFSCKEGLFTVFLNEIELYLFETQIGFLVYELEYPEGSSLDTVVNCNYYVKRFKQGYTWSYLHKIAKDETKKIEFTLDELTEKILAPLKVKTYFEKRDVLPDHALVYNAAILNPTFTQGADWETEFKEYLFRMRRSFKESYRPSPAEFQVENNREILHLFENSYWGVSLEGLANLVYQVENPLTNIYFEGNYYGNLKTTYFYMYMLALHQRYALLHLTAQASELPRSLAQSIKIEEDTIEQVEEIFDLKERILFFILRSSVKHITFISHQSAFYQMVLHALDIEDLRSELHFELEALSSMTEMKEQKERKKQEIKEQKRKDMEEKRKSRAEDYIFLLTLIFVGFSTASDCWNLISSLFISNQLATASAAVKLLSGAALLVILIVILISIRIKSRVLPTKHH